MHPVVQAQRWLENLSRDIRQLDADDKQRNLAGYMHAFTSRQRLAEQHRLVVKERAVRTPGDAFVQSVENGYYMSARITRLLLVPVTRTLDFITGNQRHRDKHAWRDTGVLPALMRPLARMATFASFSTGALMGAVVGAGSDENMLQGVLKGTKAGAEVGGVTGALLFMGAVWAVTQAGSLLSAGCKQVITTLGGIPGAIIGALVGLTRMIAFKPNKEATVDEKIGRCRFLSDDRTKKVTDIPRGRLRFLPTKKGLIGMDVRELARELVELGPGVTNQLNYEGLRRVIAGDAGAQRIFDSAASTREVDDVCHTIDQTAQWLEAFRERYDIH